jgi:hypothetical protein
VLCLPISCYQDDHSLSDSLGDAGGTARAQAAMCAQGVQQPYLRCTVACNGVPRCAVLRFCRFVFLQVCIASRGVIKHTHHPVGWRPASTQPATVLWHAVTCCAVLCCAYVGLTSRAGTS